MFLKTQTGKLQHLLVKILRKILLVLPCSLELHGYQLKDRLIGLYHEMITPKLMLETMKINEKSWRGDNLILDTGMRLLRDVLLKQLTIIHRMKLSRIGYLNQTCNQKQMERSIIFWERE